MNQLVPFWKKAALLGSFFFGNLMVSSAEILQNPNYLESISGGGISYIENAGQWNDSAKFKADLPGGAVFITDYGFRYIFEDLAQLQAAHDEFDQRDVTKDLITRHVFDVIFENSLMNGQFTQGNKKTTYHNYYLGNDPSKWASDVSLFDYVGQQSLYNNIDLVLYSKEKTMRYDLIVQPGGNVGDILINYEGVEVELDHAGRLLITTAVNEYYEDKPYVYQMINGQEIEIESAYTITNGKVGFAILGNYDTSIPLVIDPDLIFSTFSGATASNVYSYATTYDIDGHHYGGADVRSIGWPTNVGVFQEAFGGAQDIGVNKISPDGSVLVYATYIGGASVEEPYALLVNQHDNSLLIAGGTQSNNLPMHPDAYIGQQSTSKRSFVINISTDGTTLLGSTFLTLGGNNYGTFSNPNSNAYNNSIMFSQNILQPFDLLVTEENEIWIGGNIQGDTGDPTSNAFQNDYAGGVSDGFVMKLNSELSQLDFYSYIGGTLADGITALKQNGQGNIVISGITMSEDFPTTSGALIEDVPGTGHSHGFVSVINNVSYELLHSTYLGLSDASSQAVDLSIYEDEVHVLGRTRGNYPISNDVYNLGPNRDVFVHVLNEDLSATIRTTSAGYPISHTSQFFPTAFMVDACGYTYIGGLSQLSSYGLPSDLSSRMTDDAFSTNLNNRFYFMVFDSELSDLMFGSSFGSGTSDHTHMGKTRMDPEGIVYHSICANQPNYPITPGVFAEIKQTSGQDIVSFKFLMGATSPVAVISSDNLMDTACAPYTIQFDAVFTPESEILWDFGDGNTSNLPSPTHTYTEAGEYEVTFTVMNEGFCIAVNRDTTFITIYEAFKPQVTFENRIVCGATDTLQLHIDIANYNDNMAIHWSNVPGLLSASDEATVIVDPMAGTIFPFTVKDSYMPFCDSVFADTVFIDFAPRAVEIITNDTTICKGQSVLVNATGTPGYEYQWSPPHGVSDPHSLNTTIAPIENEVYTLTGSYANCTDTSVTISFIVEDVPELILSNDTTVCKGTKVAIEGLVTPYHPNYEYEWLNTEGLFDFAGPSAYTIADEEKEYVLKVTSPNGCFVTDTFRLFLHPELIGSITDNTGYCPPDSVALSVMGGSRYSWEPSYGLDRTDRQQVWASPDVPTEYTVYVVDSNQCKDTLTVFVDVYPLAVINIPDEVNLFPGESYQLQPFTNAMYFNWFPPSGISDVSISNPEFSPIVNTRYFVEATTEQGCIVNDSISFILKGDVFDIPNAFHPKGESGTFKIQKRGNIQLKKFEIYNRWGTQVYSSQDIEEGWDGMYGDTPQPMGVYVYIVEVVMPDGQIVSKTGNLTLVR